ncbi:MAG TPA: hypothetical protein VHN78_16065, partial [Chloroflexota bacterium]|nr:hypothetical protein [Chloroflexota bacterium]
RDLPAGNYGIAFTAPAKEGEPALQEEAREFSVSPGKVETVSVVLLAENIARPTVPPAELTQAAQQGQSGGFGSSLTSNPFFWYFVFNQPWLGGYQRPPVVVYAPGQDRPVVADSSQSQPGRPGRSYSSYGPPGTAGTKPAPQVVDSKGVTRPGANAAIPGGGAGTSPALDDSSRGVTRPGQAPSGSAGSASGAGSSASRTDQSGSPPRVGAGGGSTAGRSPSRGVSPPRVRAGRR